MEQIIDSEISTSTNRIYTERAIWLGTFLGGPITGGYFIAENFKTFHDKTNVVKTWVGTIVISLLLIASTLFIPATDKIPGVTYAFVYTFIASLVVKHYQQTKIAQFLSEGGLPHKRWTVIGRGSIGFFIMLAVIVIVVIVFDLDVK